MSRNEVYMLERKTKILVLFTPPTRSEDPSVPMHIVYALLIVHYASGKINIVNPERKTYRVILPKM